MKFIGVDLGGTAIKAGIVDGEGNIIKKSNIATPVNEGFEGVTRAISRLIDNIIKDCEIDKKEIKAIGIGIPGPCSQEGYVYVAVNLFWKDVPLGQKLEELTGYKVYVENDATVAAIGESVKGATVGIKNSVFLTLGTGVGGGIIINKNVYSGEHGIGSEIGHMIVGENDYDCNCGNNGCLETFASATALIRYAKKLLVSNKDSMIIQKVKGNTDFINAKTIFDCAKEGDPVALKAVNRLVKYLAIGIGNIVNILDPEIIAIGGGLSKTGNYLIDKLEKEVPKYVWLKDRIPVNIVLAQLENDAGIIGSAMYAKSRHGDIK